MSRTARWIIGTSGLAFALATFYVGMTVPVGNPGALQIVGCFLLLIPLACAGRRPGRIAGRIIAAVIFATCVAYIVSELRHTHAVFEGGQYHKSAENWLNASIAMIVFGLPAGWYAAMGRFPPWIEPCEDEHSGVENEGLMYDD